MSETQDLQRGPAAIEQGLSGQEAARRLQQDGYNELPQRHKRTALNTAASIAREPMFLLLLAAGTIYLLVGDLSDALLLLGFVVVSMAITVFQERKTERVLENLKHLSSPRALVIRDGEPVRIPGREVVTGDLLVLEEGDRIAADGPLIESHDLLIDESLLTGESIAAEKAAPTRGPLGDPSLQQVYSGSLVVRGGGLARVSAIGARTELGKIGQSLQTVTPEQSPLQKEIKRLTKRFALFGAAISVLAFFLLTGLRGDWLSGLLTGTALAMSMLPEEFTVIFTVFMALGAWRIAKNQVLTRHTPVIEALGAATVLCVDKTGTLTQNRMSVRAVIVDHDCFATDAMHREPVPESVREVLKHAVLASEVLPFDPMEKALHRALESIAPGVNAGLGHAVLIHDYPLTSDRLAMTHAWRFPGEPAYAFAPVHIAFLEMIINPACALIYEPEAADRDLMKTPPRPAVERLFGAKNVAFAVLLGFGSFVAVAAVFYFGLAAGLNEGQARALGFTSIVLGNLSLIVSTRSMCLGLPALIRIPNHAQWWILGGAAIALAAVLGVPALQAIFHFSPVQPKYLLAVAAACMAALAWFEAIKRAFWIRLPHSAMRIDNT